MFKAMRNILAFWAAVVLVAALFAVSPVATAAKPKQVSVTGSPEFAKLSLRSAAAVILDQESGEVLYGKNHNTVTPIASITKLMTAMVVLDAGLDPEELVTIIRRDIDYTKGSRSRLATGMTLKRDELLLIALMASENRAAAALAHSHPGGQPAFVQAMNDKARQLGLHDTHFVEPTGLSSDNVSTAEDLSKLVRAAYDYPRIRGYTTATSYRLNAGRRVLSFHNTNRLVQNGGWHIGLSKTGYISEAGRCLVMQATLAARPVIIVLLDSWGKLSRIGDATRIRRWLETSSGPMRQSTSDRREVLTGG